MGENRFATRMGECSLNFPLQKINWIHLSPDTSIHGVTCAQPLVVESGKDCRPSKFSRRAWRRFGKCCSQIRKTKMSLPQPFHVRRWGEMSWRLTLEVWGNNVRPKWCTSRTWEWLTIEMLVGPKNEMNLMQPAAFRKRRRFSSTLTCEDVFKNALESSQEWIRFSSCPSPLKKWGQFSCDPSPRGSRKENALAP